METKGKRAAVAARSDSRLGFFLVALLLPGGFLALAWLLYRKWLAQPEKRIPAARLIPLVALVALLQGCATQLALHPETEPRNPETPSAVRVLQFQRNSIVPADPDALLAPHALQPGDILLSSMPGLAAVGIKMMTFAPISHAAVYVGDRQVVEAVRSGVRVRSIDEVLAEETVVLVFRYPDLDAEQARRIGDYALEKSGAGFNFAGVTLNIPLSITRRVCELPLVPSAVRDACIRSMGLIHQLAASENQMFCSQLVLQAYRHAGVPITDADSRLISPADILHMREGDVSSVRPHKLLRYVGHMKYERPITVAFQR
jgi:hypothetical protein